MKDLQCSDARALMSNHFYPSNSILEETYIGELHECKGCNRTYRGECCKHCYKTPEARDEAYKLRLSLQRLNEENEIKRIKKRVKEEAIERLKTLQGENND